MEGFGNIDGHFIEEDDGHGHFEAKEVWLVIAIGIDGTSNIFAQILIVVAVVELSVGGLSSNDEGFLVLVIGHRRGSDPLVVSPDGGCGCTVVCNAGIEGFLDMSARLSWVTRLYSSLAVYASK